MAACCSGGTVITAERWRTALDVLVYYAPFVTSFVFRIGVSIYSPFLVMYLYDSVCERHFAKLYQKMYQTLIDISNEVNNATGTAAGKYVDDLLADQSLINLTSLNNTPAINCQQLSAENENLIQTEATNYIMLLKILDCIPSFAMAIYCGGWMDRIGRRIPMLLSLLGGMAVAIILSIVQALHGDALVVVIISVVLYAIIGPSTVVPAAIDALISRRTAAADRTWQLSINMAIVYMGLFIGSLIVGVTADRVQIWNMFLAAAAAFVLTFVLVFFSSRDDGSKLEPPSLLSSTDNKIDSGTAPLEEAPLDDSNNNDNSEVALKETEMATTLDKVRSFYQLKNFSDAIDTLSKKRQNNMRLNILLTLLVVVAMMMCKSGESDLVFLFVRHQPLDWSKSHYGYLLSLQYGVVGVALIFLLPVLVKVLKVSDASVVIGGLVVKAAGLLLFGFSDDSWMVYLAIALMASFGVIAACLLSMLSKMVGDDESSRCFTIIAATSAISELVGTVIFTRLYYVGINLPSHYGRSIPFFVMAVIHILAMGLVVYISCNLKKAALNSSNNNQLKTEDDAANYEPIKDDKQLIIIDPSSTSLIPTDDF